MPTSRDIVNENYPIPPGETIREMLLERHMTQTKLAKRLGASPKHVNQVVRGVSSLSTEFALSLERELGVSAEFWVKREALYQLAKARLRMLNDNN